MTNKLFKLASLALVAGFMTSSLDAMNVNKDSAQSSQPDQSRLVLVQLGSADVVVNCSPDQSREDIYNVISSWAQQKALEDSSVTDYLVNVFSKGKAKECADRFQSAFADLMSKYPNLDYIRYPGLTVNFGNNGDSLQNVGPFISIEQSSDITQQFYDDIKGKVTQKLSENAEITKKILAEYWARNMANYLYNTKVAGNS